ncbi:AAA family ATPase [Desulfurivibrio alkaliphilus]|uniref:Cobyrinic acid ac-diamide synthase n=1 Tax=Desulfurivibrio alkaliphilus (strain DSM 19089 / UNIQEM U267 / AHT2) TaxID=589865 RepID=D6Z2V2_DESAT|nr:AAA family ATPase [Desulfurivibrio alkaliphilus]ADH85877.1 Cobyrinic acid ac-diamide synthase [Desulfurivibrio alkaliphilus AHT 2]
MPKIIAMAGKGGVGKTTVTALLLNYLLAEKKTPVLAVDADANANLNELLGLEVGLTIGQVRKEMKGDLPPHITRDQYMEMKVHQALVEAGGFDLLTMGQPDGPGCYCSANQFLAMTMDHLAGNYEYILVDNEAGMEHLSRMNLRVIDLLLVVSDPSARGIMTAGRIAGLTEPLGIAPGKKCLLVNRAPAAPEAALTAKIDETTQSSGLELAGLLPQSESLAAWELAGRSYLDLPADEPVLPAAREIFGRILP